MAIIAYQKNNQTLYMVVAEAINKYTGKRIQKKRRGISSLPKAERIYRELWSVCRETRPDGINFTLWGELLDHYSDHCYSKQRSPENVNGFSPHTLKVKRSRLKHTEKWREIHIDLVTPKFVTDELDQLEQNGQSRGVTNQILKEVKCAFTYALHCGVIKANPFVGMKMRRAPKKRKEALTHEEANRLLREAKKRNHPYYVIWALTLALGLRRSELAGLKWLDVDFDQGLIYLRRQLIPNEGLVEFLKDREERVVAIPEFVLPVLKEAKLKSSTDFVIEVKCHKWNSGQQAEVLKSFCKEIGIKEVTHHQLRATHITLALVDGIPLGIVKENVGHAKLSTTDLYFRSAGINMRGQMDGLKIKVPQSGMADILPIPTISCKLLK